MATVLMWFEVEDMVEDGGEDAGEAFSMCSDGGNVTVQRYGFTVTVVLVVMRGRRSSFIAFHRYWSALSSKAEGQRRVRVSKCGE